MSAYELNNRFWYLHNKLDSQVNLTSQERSVIIDEMKTVASQLDAILGPAPFDVSSVEMVEQFLSWE